MVGGDFYATILGLGPTALSDESQNKRRRQSFSVQTPAAKRNALLSDVCAEAQPDYPSTSVRKSDKLLALDSMHIEMERGLRTRLLNGQGNWSQQVPTLFLCKLIGAICFLFICL